MESVTLEEIELEGWVKEPGLALKKYSEDGGYYYTKINFPDTEKLLMIGKYTPADHTDLWAMSSWRTVYNGPCPSIENFRYICKLLGI
jgi:hypothetical protein